MHEAGVQLEDFGGDVQAIPISALNGDGVEDLIEALLAQSEVLQLSADPKGPVEGSIIESNMELGLGKTEKLVRSIISLNSTSIRVLEAPHVRKTLSHLIFVENKFSGACRIHVWIALT